MIYLLYVAIAFFFLFINLSPKKSGVTNLKFKDTTTFLEITIQLNTITIIKKRIVRFSLNGIPEGEYDIELAIGGETATFNTVGVVNNKIQLQYTQIILPQSRITKYTIPLLFPITINQIAYVNYDSNNVGYSLSSDNKNIII